MTRDLVTEWWETPSDMIKVRYLRPQGRDWEEVHERIEALAEELRRQCCRLKRVTIKAGMDSARGKR